MTDKLSDPVPAKEPYRYIHGQYMPCTLDNMLADFENMEGELYMSMYTGSDTQPWLANLINLLRAEMQRKDEIYFQTMNDVFEVCPDYADRVLRKAGLDPEQIGKDMQALADKALGERRAEFEQVCEGRGSHEWYLIKGLKVCRQCGKRETL